MDKNKFSLSKLRHAELVLFKFGTLIYVPTLLVLTIILKELFNIWHIHSYVYSHIIYLTSYILSALPVYFFHSRITFRMKKKRILDFLKFTISQTIVVIVSVTLISYLSMLKINYILPLLIISIPISLINFKLNKNWIFKNDAKD